MCRRGSGDYSMHCFLRIQAGRCQQEASSGGCEEVSPKDVKMVKLNELSKGCLTRYAARDFLDNGFVEVRVIVKTMNLSRT